MMANKTSVTENVENREKYSADLEEALTTVGFGWYNIKYCLLLALFLVAAIVEPMGYSYLLPAAKCDMEMTPAQRGFISSIPYIGIVLTSFPWGYIVDTRGRKQALVYSALVAGVFGTLAGFMPEIYSFTVCKIISALCTACSAAVPFTFIGEILPLKYRDVCLSAVNCLQVLGSSLIPLFAMGVLHFDFRINFILYYFRPWRLLCMVYSSLFIICAFLMSFGPESPKFLVVQGKVDEALRTLQLMYAGNTGKAPDAFPITSLKITEEKQKEEISFLRSLKVQTMPILRRPYLKWLALNGFLLFGIYAMCNGLYIWVPGVINRVFISGSTNSNACTIISQGLNQTAPEVTICNDSIDIKTFVVNFASGVVCAAISLPISLTVNYMDKKILLILVYVVMAIVCYAVNHVTNQIVFACMLLSVALSGLGLGPVNAFTVEKFPTHLRGMAMSLTMLIGRSGSIVSANAVGTLINAACEATFYMYGGLCTVCAILGLLIPSSSRNEQTEK